MTTEIQTLEQQLKPLSAQVSELFDTFQILATADDRFDSDEYDPDFPRCCDVGGGDYLARAGICRYVGDYCATEKSEFLEDLIKEYKDQFQTLIIIAMDSADRSHTVYAAHFGSYFTCLQSAFMFGCTSVVASVMEADFDDEDEDDEM